MSPAAKTEPLLADPGSFGVTETGASRPAKVETTHSAFMRSSGMSWPSTRLQTSFVELRSPTDSADIRLHLRDALRSFWPDTTMASLVVLPREAPHDHRTARAQAYWIRYHLHYLHLEHQSGVVTDAEDEALRRQYGGLIADTVGFIGPRVRVGQADIMMTAFNHLYDREHPRYGHQVAFPMVRSRDLMNVQYRRPELSRKIATRSRIKIVLSMLDSREGIKIADVESEYSRWLQVFGELRDFVTEIYVDSLRGDARNLPHLAEKRQAVTDHLGSRQFKVSLLALRVRVRKDRQLPILARILTENPTVSVFDIAKVIFGDIAAMYLPPPIPAP